MVIRGECNDHLGRRKQCQQTEPKNCCAHKSCANRHPFYTPRTPRSPSPFVLWSHRSWLETAQAAWSRMGTLNVNQPAKALTHFAFQIFWKLYEYCTPFDSLSLSLPPHATRLPSPSVSSASKLACCLLVQWILPQNSYVGIASRRYRCYRAATVPLHVAAYSLPYRVLRFHLTKRTQSVKTIQTFVSLAQGEETFLNNQPTSVCVCVFMFVMQNVKSW